MSDKTEIYQICYFMHNDNINLLFASTLYNNFMFLNNISYLVVRYTYKSIKNIIYLPTA